MDIRKTCLSETISTIPNSTHRTTESNSRSTSSSEGSEIKNCDELSNTPHSIKRLPEKFTCEKPENSARKFIEETKKHIFSDSDDSFEVFLPQKSSNVKSILNSKSIGKFKTKKTTRQSRSCPYFPAKTVQSYFKPISKSQEEKDLEIAIARSLLDVSGSIETAVKYSTSTSCEGADEKPDVNTFQQRPVAKENALKLKNWTGKDTKKHNKTLLQRRTPEDREFIITQKLAIILIDEKKENSEKWFLKRDIELSSSVLERFFDKKSRLWELSKLTVDGYIPDFYVSSLKRFIDQPSSWVFYEDSLDTPEFKMSSSSGSVEMLGEIQEPDEKDILVIDIEDEDDNIGEKNVKDTAEAFTASKEYPPTFSSLESMTELSKDWAALYGDVSFADCDIRVGQEVVPGHKIVFYARCRPLLDDIDYSTDPCVMDLSRYYPKAAKAFLQFLYSGNIDPNLYLTNFEKSDFTILCKKYNFPYLENFFRPTFFDTIYSQSTWSIESKDGSQRQDDHGTITNASKSRSNISSESHSNSGDPLMVSDNSSESLHNNKANKTPGRSSRPFGLFSRSSPNLFMSPHSSVDASFSFQAKRKLNLDKTCNQKINSESPSSSKKILKNNSKSSPAKKVRKNTSPSPSPAKNVVKINSEFLSPVKKISKNTSIIFVESDSSDGSNSVFPINQPQTSENIELNNTNYGNAHGFDETFRNSFGFNISEYNKEIEFINYGGSPDQASAGSKEINEETEFAATYSKISEKSFPKNNETHDISLSKDLNLSYGSPKLCESFLHFSPCTSFVPSSSKGKPPDDCEEPSLTLPPSETMEVVEVEGQPNRKSSLGAYLQSSFPDTSVLDEVEMQVKTFQASTPIASPAPAPPPVQNINTPKGETSLIIKDATPRSDYATMISPQLRDELKRFGLKQSLPRDKAVTLLGYIYEQLHPEIPEEPRPSTSKVSDTGTFDSDSEQQRSNEFFYEESMLNKSVSEESELPSNKIKELRGRILNFLKSDPDLHTSVITFKPLWLHEFHKTIKDNGIKCSVSKLMYILDDLSVTFRIKRPEKTRTWTKKTKTRKKTSKINI